MTHLELYALTGFMFFGGLIGFAFFWMVLANRLVKWNDRRLERAWKNRMNRQLRAYRCRQTCVYEFGPDSCDAFGTPCIVFKQEQRALRQPKKGMS